MRKQTLPAKQLQVAALSELGQKLAQSREQRELSVEELAVKTHIPARLLTAIEAGELTQLPEPVYIQSFIRQYANAIGLNGVQLASEFPVEPVVQPARQAWLFKPSFHLRPLHLYAVYVVMILGAVQGLSVVLNQSANRLPTLPNATPSQSGGQPQVPVGPNQPLPDPAIANQKTANALSPAPVAGKAVRVDLTLTDSSWVQVVVDGKPEYEGVMKPGDQRMLSGAQRVVITAGNAGGVIATFNGEAKPLGAVGDVQSVSFPPDPKDLADVRNPTKVASSGEE
jgi:cytoskeletal protein RodZ